MLTEFQEIVHNRLTNLLHEIEQEEIMVTCQADTKGFYQLLSKWLKSSTGVFLGVAITLRDQVV